MPQDLNPEHECYAAFVRTSEDGPWELWAVAQKGDTRFRVDNPELYGLAFDVMSGYEHSNAKLARVRVTVLETVPFPLQR